MATWSPVGELRQELTCSLCVDFFKDPVTIPECGHSFCQGCLAQCWGEAKAKASCPLCKQTVQPRNLQPSQRLANMVEAVKKQSIQGREGGETEKTFCEKHQAPLNFFCQTDQVPVCAFGKISKKHRDHEVVPIGEASQEYKDEMFRHLLETLKAKREKIKKEVKDVKNESQEMLKTTESERQKTEAEFRMLRQLMKDEEDYVLSQVEEVEKEIARQRDEHRARLSKELSALESLIQEMEGKRPETTPQDVKSTLKKLSAFYASSNAKRKADFCTSDAKSKRHSGSNHS